LLCRANSAQIGQSRPDPGLGLSHLQAKVCKPLEAVPISLGSGGRGACKLHRIQGYLAHEKTPCPTTLQSPCACGPTVVLGGGAVYYERGNPVAEAAEATHAASQDAGRMVEGLRDLITLPLPSEEGTPYIKKGLLSESQGQNLASTVLCVPYSLVILGGGHTRQEDVEVSPTQSRISPSIQRILRTAEGPAGCGESQNQRTRAIQLRLRPVG